MKIDLIRYTLLSGYTVLIEQLEEEMRSRTYQCEENGQSRV